MPEIRDIYNSAGEPTGRTFQVDERLAPGEYFLHVIVLLRGRGGKYLLQQRSVQKRYYPGKWDVTGGGVISGETSLDAAAREVHEEIGLKFELNRFVFGGRIMQSGDSFFDMYGINGDFAEEDCVLHEAEVDAVRLVDYDEFLRIVRYNKDDLFLGLMQRTREMLENA